MKIDVHVGPTLSPYLFLLAYEGAQDEVLWCKSFANYVGLVYENTKMEGKLCKKQTFARGIVDKWIKYNKGKTNIKFLEFKFQNKIGGNESDNNVRLESAFTCKVEKFNYLGLAVQETGGILKDVTSRIKCDWIKVTKSSCSAVW